MTYILEEDDKLTIEEALQHYGVMGMKWGVRRDRSSGRTKKASKTKKPPPPTGADIKKARARVAAKERKIQVQVDTVNASKAGKQQADAFLKLNKMQADLLKDPDRATAKRMTAGEKAALTTMAIVLPGVGTVAAATVASLNVAGQKQAEKLSRKS